MLKLFFLTSKRDFPRNSIVRRRLARIVSTSSGRKRLVHCPWKIKPGKNYRRCRIILLVMDFFVQSTSLKRSLPSCTYLGYLSCAYRKRFLSGSNKSADEPNALFFAASTRRRFSLGIILRMRRVWRCSLISAKGCCILRSTSERSWLTKWVLAKRFKPSPPVLCCIV